MTIPLVKEYKGAASYADSRKASVGCRIIYTLKTKNRPEGWLLLPRKLPAFEGIEKLFAFGSAQPSSKA